MQKSTKTILLVTHATILSFPIILLTPFNNLRIPHPALYVATTFTYELVSLCSLIGTLVGAAFYFVRKACVLKIRKIFLLNAFILLLTSLFWSIALQAATNILPTDTMF